MSGLRTFWSKGPWLRGRPPGRGRAVPTLVWLAFLLVPLVTAVTNKGAGHGWTISAAAVFTLGYVWLVLILFRDEARATRRALGGVLLAVAIVLTVADPSGWGFLFTYCSACAALVAPAGLGFGAVAACSVLAVVCAALGGASNGAAVGYGASAIGVGLLMVLMRDLRMRNQELTEARAELARTVVVRERERFARDLHDLLGHSLSVIALKAELAGRLLPDRAAEAAGEVAELEQVACNALSEVRDAVTGYRRPTLDGELAGARMALSRAGIKAQTERRQVAFDAEVEAILAWAVREAATNVIRHSGARRCTVKITSGRDGAGVEVLDDGAGARFPAGVWSGTEAGVGVGVGVGVGQPPRAVNGHGGHGLAGLSERAESLHGRIEAGPLPDGGFRPAVSVPVTDR